MGIEKVIGFMVAMAGGFIVLLATFIFALITYKRRKEFGFLLMLCAVGCGLVANILAVIFLAPGTLFPVDYATSLFVQKLRWGLQMIAPVLTLIGFVFLARKKKES
jgi:hypothetical protein